MYIESNMNDGLTDGNLQLTFADLLRQRVRGQNTVPSVTEKAKYT